MSIAVDCMKSPGKLGRKREVFRSLTHAAGEGLADRAVHGMEALIAILR